ncbi:hypothetical protein AMS68_001688 [Peltaster fructicola]|uniref:SAM-dependent MTase RsmB/NOP-type domain-containing protein n=1 Tax=Peltaster fructicola TaxID=286661 RepID=A0A6H0XNE2_9PEZI|nr:hypothetical protein AMS68_001688 [Peltaster fructicola]
MSLYHEAASVLTKSQAEAVSIQTTVFAKKDWKSPSKVLVALASEAAKWSSILSIVVEQSGVLRIEKQLTPVLAILLVHDLLLTKKGVALPIKHGLNASVQRHKARLAAELTKLRIRRGCSTLDQLREKVEQEAALALHDNAPIKHPRWIRINTILDSKEEQLATTFADFVEVKTVEEIQRADAGSRLVFIDTHIPNLIAVPSTTDLISSEAYKDGKIIFQDKASCFPAYLINPQAHDGDVIDACAAPGNKTTHLAAILNHNIRTSQKPSSQVIFACEKDAFRGKTLSKMTALAGGEKLIQVKQPQNFHKLNPDDSAFAQVTKLLLDPSCSGSGIVSRDQGAVTVHLPVEKEAAMKSKKRKRSSEIVNELIEEETPAELADDQKLNERLQSLAEFQLRLILHAMLFPAATQISYSTCSIHAKENEEVVIRALQSPQARSRGWSIQRRAQQVEGIRRWHVRGDVRAVKEILGSESLDGVPADDLAEACVRCEKHGTDGTMGFFVAGFIREAPSISDELSDSNSEVVDDWSGFDDI